VRHSLLADGSITLLFPFLRCGRVLDFLVIGFFVLRND